MISTEIYRLPIFLLLLLCNSMFAQCSIDFTAGGSLKGVSFSYTLFDENMESQFTETTFKSYIVKYYGHRMSDIFPIHCNKNDKPARLVIGFHGLESFHISKFSSSLQRVANNNEPISITHYLKELYNSEELSKFTQGLKIIKLSISQTPTLQNLFQRSSFYPIDSIYVMWNSKASSTLPQYINGKQYEIIPLDKSKNIEGIIPIESNDSKPLEKDISQAKRQGVLRTTTLTITSSTALPEEKNFYYDLLGSNRINWEESSIRRKQSTISCSTIVQRYDFSKSFTILTIPRGYKRSSTQLTSAALQCTVKLDDSYQGKIHLEKDKPYHFIYVSSYNLHNRKEWYDNLLSFFHSIEVDKRPYTFILSNFNRSLISHKEYHDLLQQVVENDFDPPDIFTDTKLISQSLNNKDIMINNREIIFDFFFTEKIHPRTSIKIIDRVVTLVNVSPHTIRIHLLEGERYNLDILQKAVDNIDMRGIQYVEY